MSVMDFGGYTAPGVYTETVPGPQIGVISGAPRAVGIFGDTVLSRTDVETVVIPEDVADEPQESVSLRREGVIPGSVVVSDPLSGITYTLYDGTSGDYEVVVNTKGNENGRDDTVTLKRRADGDLEENRQVQVSYRYVNKEYFNPTRFFTYEDVVSAYGSPFDSDGNIVSELSLACMFAFLNGAQEVVAVAVDHEGEGETPAQAYQGAINKLAGLANISVVVSASGRTEIFDFVRQYVRAESNNRREKRAILGMDGSVSPLSSALRINAAGGIREARVALVSPDRVQYFNSITNQVQIIGGQFLAAALAGFAVSNSVATPLTRKTVSGFYGIEERAPEAQKNLEATNGLLVVEQTQQGLIRVRHGVTTDPSDLLSREWSIIGQQDELAFRIRSFLDGDRLIGSVLTDLTLINTKASADSALQSLVSDGSIRAYSALQARQMTNRPDIIEIRFNWQPSMPLNYIVAMFSIDLSTGETSATDATAV